MRKLLVTILLSVISLYSWAQGDVVEVRPYADLRTFHLGIVIGTHFQDLEFVNVGPQTITYSDGTTSDVDVSCDQGKWNLGFNVGVLGELRLSDHFSFRAAPQLYFGTRDLTFHDHKLLDENGDPLEKTQSMKSVYVALPMDIILNARRHGNVRPYMMAGLNPMINLSGNSGENILQLKKHDLMLEAGIGFDFYLPYFKVRPELKFCYSLYDVFDASHVDDIQDENLYPYAKSVKSARNKFIVLSFYFD